MTSYSKPKGVYTSGRSFSTLNIADSDGVIRQNTLDWAAGLISHCSAETRLNVQLFQRHFFGYDSNITADRYENGYSLLLNNKFFNNWEAQALFISSLNRTDWLFLSTLDVEL